MKNAFVGDRCNWFLVMAVMLVCLGGKPVSAQEKDEVSPLAYLNDNIDSLFVLRVSDLLKTDQVREFKSKGGDVAKFVEKQIGDEYFSKAGIDRAEDLSLFVSASSGPANQFWQIYHTVKDNEVGFDLVVELAEETLKHKGKEYFRFKRKQSLGGVRFAYIASKRQMVWASNETAIQKAIDAGIEGPKPSEWKKQWEKYAKKHASMVAGKESLRQMQMLPAPFSTLTKANLMVGGAQLDGKLKAEIQCLCSERSDAREMAEAGEEMLDQARDSLNALKRLERYEEMRKPVQTGLSFIKGTEIDTEKKLVTVTTEGNLNLLDFLPAIVAVREAATRTQALNNLRQVSLSIHNFESAMGKFPDPVLISDAGKKYSWRIAILPFIEQKALYDQYRFDEDWDSPHNQKVTAVMPEVFRHPHDDPDSTSTSWHLVTGAGTIFDPEGTLGFRDITDGSSNTIMAVEAKRGIHWAKPQDIDLKDPGEMDLGGFSKEGFIATLADGSTHFVPAGYDPVKLHRLFTASDGEVQSIGNLMPDEEK